MVEQERLQYRAAYAELYQELIEEGIAIGDFPKQDARQCGRTGVSFPKRWFALWEMTACLRMRSF